MTRPAAAVPVMLALWLGACAAAVPRVDEIEVSGAARFVAPEGAIVSSGSAGLPMLVTTAGEVCSGDVVDRPLVGAEIDRIETAPEVELSLDCLSFAPRVVYSSWSPDSMRVAFMGASPGAESDIWVLDTLAGALRNVSGDAGEDTLPLWIDDETVVFVRTLEDESGTVKTSWQRVSDESGVPAQVAIVPGAVDLGGVSAVVQGSQTFVYFGLRGPDGAVLGIHRVDIATGAMDAVYVPSDETAAGGFRLLDIRPDGALALAVVGAGGLDDAASEVLLIDLEAGVERTIAPVFGTGIADIRFSADGTRLLVWEEDAGEGDALVIRSTGSGEDAEVLLHGELGSLHAIEDGVTIDVGRELVLVRAGS